MKHAVEPFTAVYEGFTELDKTLMVDGINKYDDTSTNH